MSFFSTVNENTEAAYNRWSLIAEPGRDNYTQLFDFGGHPNTQGGGIQFAVRRWNSDQDQNIKISGEVDSIGSGAVTTRIFKNEDEIYSQFLNISSAKNFVLP